MAEKTIETRPWDAAEHLETEEDMVAYLEAALVEGDASLVAAGSPPFSGS
jgi:DNA-binding phage protein